MSGESCRWVQCRRGEPLPEGAICVGITPTDGENYVARRGGEAGKVNLDKGKFHNFWGHNSGRHEDAEVLVVEETLNHIAWLPVKRGHLLPHCALLAGETKTDGVVYVGRYNNEAGKINISDANVEDRRMWNFWGDSNGRSEKAEILLVHPKILDQMKAVESPMDLWFSQFALSQLKLAAEDDCVLKVVQYGELCKDDTFKNQEYSLSHRKPYPSVEPKVELEDTENSEEKTKMALERLRSILDRLKWTGIILWTLLLVGGAIAGFGSDCDNGTPGFYFIIPIFAAGFLLYRLNQFTVLLSQTTIEGRYLVKMMMIPDGFDAYRVVAAMSLVDMFGRFTRATFVGYAIMCDDAINDLFTDSFANSPLAFITPVIDTLGLGGLAALAFIIGPVILQGGNALYNYMVMKRPLDNPVDYHETTHITNCMDELAAVAHWAMMVPAAKVLEGAALPYTWEDDNDAKRLWGSIKTMAILSTVRVVSDNIFQMILQARFFALAYPALDFFGKANILLLAFLPAGVDTILTALDLIKLNRRLTMILGGFMLVFPFGAYVRIGAAIFCESHLFNISELSCIPMSALKFHNLTAGIVAPT